MKMKILILTPNPLKSTSNKFEYGHASSLELTNASMTLLTAQSDYVQAILNLVNAQIELKKLLNK